jgi:hypothetical protein
MSHLSMSLHAGVLCNESQHIVIVTLSVGFITDNYSSILAMSDSSETSGDSIILPNSVSPW